MRNHHGFSLLELFIACSLGLLVTSGLISIYLSVSSNHKLVQVLSDLQESGRFALTILNQRIRTAGFVGCDDNLQPVNQEQAIVGYDHGHLPDELKNQVVAGTDAVVILSCENNSTISEDSHITQMAYYIGDTHRWNSQGRKILALFQKPLGSDRIELVAGIEQMQILYGPENKIAAQVENWADVRSVKIDLLINSIEPALKKSQSYYFHHQMVNSDDYLIHKPWSTYITLRERPWP